MLEPAGHRVLVRPDLIEETDEVMKAAKAAGIEVVQNERDKKAREATQQWGTLVAIGKTAWLAYDRDPETGDPIMWAEVGDRVAYAKYGGSFIEDPDTEERYVVLNDEDIKAVHHKEEVV